MYLQQQTLGLTELEYDGVLTRYVIHVKYPQIDVE